MQILAVAVGEADGGRAGLAALATVPPAVPRRAAVEAHLCELVGEHTTAARLYAEAARAASNAAERDHLTGWPPGCTSSAGAGRRPGNGPVEGTDTTFKPLNRRR